MNKERNLLWLDLEMTGLNPRYDVILEIACAITDGDLNLIAQGPSIVVHQSDEVLTRMIPEVAAIHKKSGLDLLVKGSKISSEEAEVNVVAFLSHHAQKHGLILAGNTVWQDRGFLVAYMPRIMEFLHYRIIDVTAIKELVRRWYPHNPAVHFKKSDNHRAMEDVLASIGELKHYRAHFFVKNVQ